MPEPKAYIFRCVSCKTSFMISIAGNPGTIRGRCKKCSKDVEVIEAKKSEKSDKLQRTQIRVPASQRNPSSSVRVKATSSQVSKIQFGEYILQKKLGEGCMGTVYLAEHSPTHTQCALKIISKGSEANRELLKRFQREAKVLSSLSHDNIVKFYKLGSCNGRIYMAMEYINGYNVDQLLEKNKVLSPIYAIKICLGIVKALDHALARHIIHRDIKPANILIDRDSGGVKLTDLGLGKILGDKGMTRTNELMGTPNYMAPEQIANPKEVDHHADIYALGATLYHMLSGVPPYGEVERGVHDILYAKIARDPVPISKLVPNISQNIVAIVERAMARDIKNRYQTPKEFYEDLHEVLENLS